VTTALVNRSSKLIRSHPDPWANVPDLLADIRQYTG
jgi:hypothetical protein